jgi:hypothetical protein
MAITDSSLFFQGYIGNQQGGAVYSRRATDRYTRSISFPTSGNVYVAAMIRVDSATSPGDYVICFQNDNTSKARIMVKPETTDSTRMFNFGLGGKKEADPIVWGRTKYSYGTTYLVVMKYTIVPTTTTDDKYVLFVNPTVGGAEPATPAVSWLTGTGADVGYLSTGVGGRSVTFDIKGGLNSCTSIDGIRIADSWQLAVPKPPYYYKGSGDVTDVANWGTNPNGSGTAPADFSSDLQMYYVGNTPEVTLGSSAIWLLSGNGSKIVVTPGTNFIVSNGSTIFGTVPFDIAQSAVLTLQSNNPSTWPTFGSILGTVSINSPTLSSNYTLPRSTGVYELVNGDLHLAGFTLTVKGKLRLNSYIVSDAGTFILDSGATLTMYSPDGITPSGTTGDIQATNRTFSRYASYIYAGSVNQVTGTAIPDTVSNLTVSMTNRKLTTGLSKNIVVTGTLTMNSGKYKLGGYNLLFSNPSGHSDTSYVITDSTGALIRTAANTSKKTMPIGSELEYRPVVLTFESLPTGTRNLAFRYVTGDTGSAGFPSNIYYRYKGGYWNIAVDSANNPTYRLDITSPFGFAEPSTRRIIHRPNPSTPWDTVGTFAGYTADTVNQVGIDKFGQFAIGVGAPVPVTTGKRYEDEVFLSYQIQSGIAYGTDPKQVLDLYTGTADNVINRPLVIFIPGGGFKAVNAPGQFSDVMGGGLAKRGYVVANIRYYRTTSPIATDSVHFETMLKAQQDVKAAIRFLRKNGTMYGIDTSQIFLTGSSAGSITALHIAYLDSSEIPENAVNWTKLGGTFDGPDRGTPGVSTRISGVIANWGAIGDTAWMKNSALPVYCVHGTTDSTVFYDSIPSDGPFKYSSKYIVAAAKQRGINAELKTYPNTGHTLDNDVAKQTDAYKLSGAWLFTLLKKGPDGVVELHSAVPTAFALHQNFPNPFNPATTIQFDLPQRSNVTLSVYNVLGQKVAKLVDEVRPAGKHAVVFDASRYASGLYLYRIEAGTYSRTMKMLLLK